MAKENKPTLRKAVSTARIDSGAVTDSIDQATLFVRKAFCRFGKRASRMILDWPNPGWEERLNKTLPAQAAN